jgi:hypothetical protein
MAFTSTEQYWPQPSTGMGVFDYGYNNIGTSGTGITSTGAGYLGFSTSPFGSMRVTFDVAAVKFYSATSNPANPTDGYLVDINSPSAGKWRIILSTANSTYDSDNVGYLRDFVDVDWTTGSTVELFMVRTHLTFSVYQIIGGGTAAHKLLVQLRAKGVTVGGQFDQTGYYFGAVFPGSGFTIRSMRWCALYPQSEILGFGVSSRTILYSAFTTALNPYNPYTDMNASYSAQCSPYNASFNTAYSDGTQLIMPASMSPGTLISATNVNNAAFTTWGMTYVVAFRLTSGGFSHTMDQAGRQLPTRPTPASRPGMI